MIMMQLIMSRNRERGQTCLRGDSFEYAVCTQGCRVLRIHANYWRREIAWRRRWNEIIYDTVRKLKKSYDYEARENLMELNWKFEFSRMRIIDDDFRI